MIRIVIADDHHLVREGIRVLLERDHEVKVIGEAQDGVQAFELTRELEPDVLLLDINMPNMNGIEVARRLHETNARTQVLILSMYSDETLVRRALRNGVKGYLLKKSISQDLIEAVHLTSQRQTYLSPELQKMVPKGFTGAEMAEEQADLFERLTNREREVCQLIAEGFTNAGIAFRLGISVKTVEKHRANMMEKLGIQDVVSLIREAIRHGVVQLDK